MFNEYEIVKLETEDNKAVLYVKHTKEEDAEFIVLDFLECENQVETINCPVESYFDVLMNPLRLNIDFKITPIHEGEKNGKTIYICPLCHDSFKVLITCFDKEVLIQFIDFVIHPQKPSKELILKQIRELYKQLEQDNKKVLETKMKIEEVEKRYVMEGY